MQVCALESIFYLDEHFNREDFHELAWSYKVKNWRVCRLNKAVSVCDFDFSLDVLYLDLYWIEWLLRLGAEVSYKQPTPRWKHTSCIPLFLLYIHKCILFHSNNYYDCWLWRYNRINQFRIYLHNDCWIYWPYFLLIP